MTALPGLVPAECTSTALPAVLRIRPAAIWDLPPFFTHTNNTLGVTDSVSVVIGLSGISSHSWTDPR